MNIKDVYLCNIYIKKECHPIFIKRTVVYWNKNGIFVDLETKEKYKAGHYIAEFGEFFVDLKGRMLPVCSTMDVTRKNLSRKKILKLVTDNVNEIEV